MNGLPADQRQRLGGGQPDDDAADEAGTGGRRDAVEIVELDGRRLQGARHEAIHHVNVGAGGDFRHHAPIGGVRRDLAQDLVGQDGAAALLIERHDGGGGFVAGGFEAEDTHCGLHGRQS